MLYILQHHSSHTVTPHPGSSRDAANIVIVVNSSCMPSIMTSVHQQTVLRLISHPPRGWCAVLGIVCIRLLGTRCLWVWNVILCALPPASKEMWGACPRCTISPAITVQNGGCLMTRLGYEEMRCFISCQVMRQGIGISIMVLINWVTHDKSHHKRGMFPPY